MASATINDVEIAYTDQGSGGTPLILLHGYPLDRTMWDEQVADLSGRQRCIAIDLRGHGESQAFFWSTSVDVYADDVAGLLDHLNIEQAVICGFSMGGYVAFAFCRNHRERLKGLILADTRAQADSPEARRGRFQSALLAQHQGSAAIADQLLPRLLSQSSITQRPDLVARVRGMIENTSVQGITGDLMALAGRPDSVDLLPTLSLPTLVLVGENDALTPLADAELISQGIPGAQLKVVAGGAHLANLENPNDWNQAVRGFMETIR